MATLPVLRETLRGQLGDIAKYAKERRFQNEVLDGALFDGIQAHNRNVTWATLPPSEEQLVLILAKVRLARDKALEYSLDPKLSAGSNFARDKSSNAYALVELAREFEAEYEFRRSKLQAQDGEIVQGTLTRESRTRRVVVPGIVARPPEKAVINGVVYSYNPDTMKGSLRIDWARILDPNIAYMRVYLSQKPQPDFSDTIVRVIYDISFQGIPPLVPIVTPDMPQVPQAGWSQEYTILPTGRWFLMIATFNWNGLHTNSDPYGFDVTNSRALTFDSYTVFDDSPPTSTTTTTTTTSTTTTSTT